MLYYIIEITLCSVLFIKINEEKKRNKVIYREI